MHPNGAFLFDNFLDKNIIFFYLKSMKNKKILPIILASVNFCLSLCLIIFLTPENVPLITGLKDEILVISSKWWLLIGAILPLIFMIFALLAKNKYSNLLFCELIIFVCYINMLGFSYFCNETTFLIGELSKIPVSLALFLPISLGVFIFGASIKQIPYKSKFGICSKRTTTTEFIWKQTHITASYHFMLSGLILLAVSIVFIFVHLPLVELAIFIIGITTPRIVVETGANKMTKKYFDMKKKYDHVQNKKK